MLPLTSQQQIDVTSHGLNLAWESVAPPFAVYATGVNSSVTCRGLLSNGQSVRLAHLLLDFHLRYMFCVAQ